MRRGILLYSGEQLFINLTFAKLISVRVHYVTQFNYDVWSCALPGCAFSRSVYNPTQIRRKNALQTGNIIPRSVITRLIMQ